MRPSARGAAAGAGAPWSGGRDDREELKARLLATRAALARREDLAAEDWTRDETVERTVGLYRYRQNGLAARALEDQRLEI